ncbi:MAG: FliI/YscN family ATPase, partial [Spirochaetaceae bacterium]
MNILEKYTVAVEQTDPIKHIGRVQSVQGLLIESLGPQAIMGELCQINIERTNQSVWAEVVGLEGHLVRLMPYTEIEGIEIGNSVVATGHGLKVGVSTAMLGRVLNAMGRPIDDGPEIVTEEQYPVLNDPPDVLTRRTIDQQVETGVRAIDALIATGKGQRLGIFSGSGVGKSTLLGMIARNTSADVNVIALIGERGREVKEFIENELGEEGLERSVVVVSTSNTPALARLRAAYVATSIAEYFRDQDNDVMLMFDSVTRFARAQREIGLARGEGPASRGFPPSVDAVLPKLLERCGTSEVGTITGFYTILVEGDDMDEPVSDTVRGILDGHLVLSRRLAQRYHYPSIDVLASVSRLERRVTPPHVQEAAGQIRTLLAAYQENEDLINAGVYVRGSSEEIDRALDKMPEINRLLRQRVEERSTLEETHRQLCELAGVPIPPGEEDPGEEDLQTAEPAAGAAIAPTQVGAWL